MPILTPYTNTDLETWELIEIGVRGGESPGVQFSKDGATGFRQFRCLWQYRYDACRFFLGDVSSYLDGSSIYRLSRLLHQSPGSLQGQPPDRFRRPESPQFDISSFSLEKRYRNHSSIATVPWFVRYPRNSSDLLFRGQTLAIR